MQGRMKNGRYQQGIGIPETLGVQPTTWNEPKPPAMSQIKFDVPNTGAQRNYGSTPNYVDTWKSRWDVPQNSGNLVKGMQARAENKKRDALDAESASRLGVSTGELRARRAYSRTLDRFDRDDDVMSRTTASGWTP
jgi:hypothetical protein